MRAAPLPPDEPERLAALHALGILDTPAEERFDRVTRVAAATFDVPIALISLLDTDRQWFRACVGLDVEGTGRDVSFCGYTILQTDALVISDALQDERFSDNPLVTGPPHIRFYAGHPVRAESGQPLGTLCIIDRRPRSLTSEQLATLADLARWAERELHLTNLADAARARSELAAVTDAVTDGLITVDAAGTIRSANPAAQQTFGYDRDELTGANVSMLVPRDRLARHEERMQAYLREGGRPLASEVHGRRKDGSVFPMDLAVNSFTHEGQRSYLAIARDITERRRTEEERRRFFRLSLEMLSIAGFDGYFKDVNPAWTEVLGFTREELMSRPYVEFVHPDDRERTAAVAGGLPQEGVVTTFENRYACRDGSYRWLRWSAAASSEEQLIYSVTTDVTEQRKTEEALRESEERHRSVIAALDEGIVMQALDGSIAWCNASAERILGLTADQMAGRASVDPRWRSVKADGTPFPGGEHPAMVCLATGEPQREVIMGVHHPNDELRWITINAQPLRGPDGKTVTGVVTSFTDVTERIALDQMKNEFVSVVSHELRTPLTAIRGALGLLANGSLVDLPPKAERMAQIATTNSDRLIRLINDILDIERMESGAETFTKRASDATALVHVAVDGVAPIAADAGVTIDVDVDADPAPLWVDPDRVVQTITNLLQNAIKYSPEGGTIRVTARREDGELVISIADEGRGIPAGKLDNVFERFQQIDASDAREKGGTGLGLTISRSIVEQHGGRIWVESEPATGSTFSFTLPVLATGASSEADARSADDATAPAAENGVTRVLIVEDDEDLAGVLVEGLSRQGLEMHHATTAADAMSLARSQRPDLVILDVALPDGNGFDIVDALRADEDLAAARIVVYSARDLDRDDRKRLDLGRASFMTKGRVAPEEFERRVLHTVGEIRADRAAGEA